MTLVRWRVLDFVVCATAGAVVNVGLFQAGWPLWSRLLVLVLVFLTSEVGRLRGVATERARHQ